MTLRLQQPKKTVDLKTAKAMKSAIKQRVKRDKQQIRWVERRVGWEGGGGGETGRRGGNHTPFGPAVAGLAVAAAVHARDAMAAGALVNHPLPGRNITPGRLLKIADGAVAG